MNQINSSWDKRLRDYELIVIISPEVNEEGLEGILSKIGQFITEKGGEVIEVDKWGRRKLAYPIMHAVEGSYVLTRFKYEPKLAAELEASLRITEGILRHLLVRVSD